MYTIEITDEKIKVKGPVSIEEGVVLARFLEEMGAGDWLPGDGECTFILSRDPNKMQISDRY